MAEEVARVARLRRRSYADARDTRCRRTGRPARESATRSGARSSAPGSREVVTPRARGSPLSSLALAVAGSTRPLPAGETPSGGPIITVRNPLSAQHSVLRQHLVASLLDASRHERASRSGADVALFEVGKGYAADADGPREWWRLALPPRRRRRAGLVEQAAARPCDLDDAKAVEASSPSDSLGAAVIRAGSPRCRRSIPGRAASVARRSIPPGAGRGQRGFPAAPDVVASGASSWSSTPTSSRRGSSRAERVVVGELAIAGLGGGGRLGAVTRSTRAARPRRWSATLPRSSRRRSTPARWWRPLRRDAGAPSCASLELFDVYRGGPLGPERRAWPSGCTLQAPDATLTDEEIDAVVGGSVTRPLARTWVPVSGPEVDVRVRGRPGAETRSPRTAARLVRRRPVTAHSPPADDRAATLAWVRSAAAGCVDVLVEFIQGRTAVRPAVHRVLRRSRSSSSASSRDASVGCSASRSLLVAFLLAAEPARAARQLARPELDPAPPGSTSRCSRSSGASSCSISRPRSPSRPSTAGRRLFARAPHARRDPRRRPRRPAGDPPDRGR